MSLHHRLASAGLYVATAESLTAGLVSSELASVPGASKYFLGGVICYQDEVKIELLGVDPALVSAKSAVDPEVAIQMAIGIRSRLAIECGKSHESVIGVSITGVAGPESVGSVPVGTVFIGISSIQGNRQLGLHLSGTRNQIRAAATKAAIAAIEDEIQAILG